MTLSKSTVASAIGLALAGASLSAQANLTTTTVLSFGSGSYFTMAVSETIFLTTNITSFQGIHIGVLQPASGSHPGQPNGTESPNVDNPWSFGGNTGMHQITGTPVGVLSMAESGKTATLNLAGWGMTWDGYPNMPLGGDPANFPADTGIARLNCSLASCSNTSSYTLAYAAHFRLGDPSGFGGVPYALHLQGQIASAVPVPATVWLFGSGLAGVAALARRRKRRA